MGSADRECDRERRRCRQGRRRACQGAAGKGQPFGHALGPDRGVERDNILCAQIAEFCLRDWPVTRSIQNVVPCHSFLARVGAEGT